LSENEKLVQIFATEDKLNSLRASKIAKEFGLNYIMKGIGNEFERIEEIKKLMLNLLFNKFSCSLWYLTPIRPTKWN
jgi:hypothetical protein